MIFKNLHNIDVLKKRKKEIFYCTRESSDASAIKVFGVRFFFLK